MFMPCIYENVDHKKLTNETGCFFCDHSSIYICFIYHAKKKYLNNRQYVVELFCLMRIVGKLLPRNLKGMRKKFFRN